MTTEHECCVVPQGNNRGNYDLAVVGAGSAGFSAAITASELGAKVALAGFGTIGGTCVNVGCVPSKFLIRAAETMHQAKAASRFAGLAGKVELLDWRAVIKQKNELVESLRNSKYLGLLPQYPNIDYLEGKAVFGADGLTIEGRALKAGKVIIATGASPAMPPIKGIQDIAALTSTTALELDTLPATLLVIGGGYIGCELAQMFSRMGVGVTIVCRSRLLPEGEPEISDALKRYFMEEGIRVVDGIEYKVIQKNGSGVRLDVIRNGVEHAIEAGQVLVTTGRKPNTGWIDGVGAGIEKDRNGAIKVDEHLRTTRPGVYAAGDVTGRDMFVYMAAYGAKIASINAIKGDERRYDSTAMPAVAFTDPQAASVGLTEHAAKAKGIKTKISVFPLEYLPRALAARDTRGLIKLVAEVGTNRLIGAHILAPEGADSIQTAAIAIKAGMTITDLADMRFPYLTTVEGIKLAAQGFEKSVSKLSCCAG